MTARVLENDLKLATADSARVIDFVRGQLDAVLRRLTFGGVRAGRVCVNSELDVAVVWGRGRLRVTAAAAARRRGEKRQGQPD
jgi:hypothetical protein